MAKPLIANELGYLLFTENGVDPSPHCLDVYRQAGDLFLRVTLDGRNPGGGLRQVILPLGVDEAEKLMNAFADALREMGQTNVSV